MSSVPSIQEMFDRAWNGLKAQGWKAAMQATDDGVYCQYLTKNGLRCAWGHVDPEGTSSDVAVGSVVSLRQLRIGIAEHLDAGELEFAMNLQRAHDSGECTCMFYRAERTVTLENNGIEGNLRALAVLYQLTIPQ